MTQPDTHDATPSDAVATIRAVTTHNTWTRHLPQPVAAALINTLTDAADAAEEHIEPVVALEARVCTHEQLAYELACAIRDAHLADWPTSTTPGEEPGTPCPTE